MWKDTLAAEEAERVVREHCSDLGSNIRPLNSGWDSWAFVVDDEWVARVPRRTEVDAALRREVGLLAAVASLLPAAVPSVVRVVPGPPVCVVHRRIAGEPAGPNDERIAGNLGRFLVALHEIELGAVPLEAVSPADWCERYTAYCAEFERRVGPLLDPDERRRGSALLSRARELEFEPALVHRDLGPEHVLCWPDGSLAGVIDWTDAGIGDPALDLAWPLYGTTRSFTQRLEEHYGVSSFLRERADFYHRLGPWFEVAYGLETERDSLVQSGLAGVRARLD